MGWLLVLRYTTASLAGATSDASIECTNHNDYMIQPTYDLKRDYFTLQNLRLFADLE